MFINKIVSKLFTKNNPINTEKKKEIKNDTIDINSFDIENKSVLKTINRVYDKNIHNIEPENIKLVLNGEINRLDNLRKKVLEEEIGKTNKEAVVDKTRLENFKSLIKQKTKG